MVHDDVELDTARPNDAMRRTVLELLDIADRAGVQLSSLAVSSSRGRVYSANLHGSTGDGWRMTHTDGLRILLRLGSRSAWTGLDEVATRAGSHPYLAVHARRDDVDVVVFCDPSPAQYADLARLEAERAAARAVELADAAGVRS